MKTYFKKLIPKRKKDSHKGDYGSVLVIAGSYGMTGAATLCCKACFYTGCGLVTLGIPESLNNIMEIKLTEVITKPLPQTDDFSLSQKAYRDVLNLSLTHDVIVIGPGLSKNEQTQKLVRKLIKSTEIPMVIDADGINALVNGVEVLKKSKSIIVITPHPGEMARLLNISIDKLKKERIKFAKQFSHNYNTIVVLKGYKTIIVSRESPVYPARYGSVRKGKGDWEDYKKMSGGVRASSEFSNGVYINNTGNPGMATAGSGDVLTGMIAGFIAQGIKPLDASKLAVYLHGQAGDLSAKDKGEISLIATDILEKIPEAIKKLEVRKQKSEDRKT